MFPLDAAQEPFYRLLGTPPADKRHVVLIDVGHCPTRQEFLREALPWLDGYFGRIDADGR